MCSRSSTGSAAWSFVRLCPYSRLLSMSSVNFESSGISSSILSAGELHRWLQVNGHDDRCQHMQPTDGGVQYGSEAEFG